MGTQTKRRWYQFGLRTFFVLVTLLAVPLGWIGWKQRIVHQRQAFLLWVEKVKDDAGRPCGIIEEMHLANPNAGVIPTWRKWLGDKPVVCIDLPPGATLEDFNKASALFPEAYILQPSYGPAFDAR